MQTLFALVIDILRGIMQMTVEKNLELPPHHLTRGRERVGVGE